MLLDLIIDSLTMASNCVSVNSIISTEVARNQLENTNTKPRMRSKSLGGKSRNGSRGSEDEEDVGKQRVHLSRSMSKPSQDQKNGETHENNDTKSSPERNIWSRLGRLRDRSPIKRSSDIQSELMGKMDQMSIKEGPNEPWGNVSIAEQMQGPMEQHYGQSDQPKSVAFGSQSKKMTPINENSQLEFDDTEIQMFGTADLNEKTLEEHEMDGKRATIKERG